MTNPTILRVAVGVIINKPGLVLISQRSAKAHLGGLWEFPGGKLEAGESPLEALQRELDEELGIKVNAAEPLIKQQHEYSNQTVELDVWLVKDFEGNPSGKEGQPVRWVSKDRLDQYPFPEANQAIITALRLPRLLPILNDKGDDWPSLLGRLEKIQQQKDIRLLIYRATGLSEPDYRSRAEQLAVRCIDMGLGLILNSTLDVARGLPVVGVHLNSQRLQALAKSGWRKPNSVIISGSCHNIADLELANQLSLDFALLSPVKPTQSHPDEPALGWSVFGDYIQRAKLPVYALGGMQRADLDDALKAGAQGVSGISGFY